MHRANNYNFIKISIRQKMNDLVFVEICDERQLMRNQEWRQAMREGTQDTEGQTERNVQSKYNFFSFKSYL